MKNIIILGDSFCQLVEGWPGFLANELNCNPIVYGYPGASWWPVRQQLFSFNADSLNNTEYIIICHTAQDRILRPGYDDRIAKTDLSVNDTSDKQELRHAIKMYYKYIHDLEITEWTESAWFRELSNNFSTYKLVHLHCFPWSWNKRHLLKGMNIWPSLASLSMNEIGAKSPADLAFCGRTNHFSNYNNWALGKELAKLLKNYTTDDVCLDTSRLQLKTNKWNDWS